MSIFKKLTSLEMAEEFIQTQKLAFLYISRPNCSICHSLLPQVEQLLENYPKIQAAHIDASEVETVAGRFSIFTVPVLLLFVEGKEYIREARIVHMQKLDERIEKIYRNMADQHET